MSSRNDFVLRIAPIHKRHSYLYIHNFPPPGYGTPPGKNVKDKYQPKDPYGLFIYPARISRHFLWLCVAIYFLIMPSFMHWSVFNKDFQLSDSSLLNYFLIGLLGGVFIIALAVVTYQLTIKILFKRMSPIFTKVWRLWPESQYDLFLTVPHLVNTPPADKNHMEHKYWRPDKPTPIYHQSSEYSKGMNTVQEVLLNLAIFELFFYNDKVEKKQVNGDEHSIKLNNWFIYYFSPVWISYFILIAGIFLYQVIPVYAIDPWSFLYQLPSLADSNYPASFINTTSSPDEVKTSIKLFNFPVNIIAASFLWLLWSIWFVWKRIEYLRALHKNVKDGLYQSHLDLVPQKILKSITRIPHEQQILAGINHLQKVLQVVNVVAFTNIMLMLEILSNVK